MEPVEFDRIRANENYFMEFYGRSLRYFNDVAKNNRLPPSRTGRFYGKCIGIRDVSIENPRQYQPNTMRSFWQLLPDKVPNTGDATFNLIQTMNDGFGIIEEIRYFIGIKNQIVANNKNKTIKDLTKNETQSSLESEIELGPETKPIQLNDIDKDKLDINREYLIDVTRGERKFTEKKRDGEISGSLIGTYEGEILNSRGGIYKFVFSNLRNIDDRPSGLDDKVDSEIILLSPLDFSVYQIHIGRGIKKRASRKCKSKRKSKHPLKINMNLVSAESNSRQ